MSKIKIGINGFGRIGRAITRINLKYNNYEIVYINEIDPDIHNIAYLLKYDSIYGKLNNKVEVEDQTLIIDNCYRIRVDHEDSIEKVPWHNLDVQVIIDSSGVNKNVLNSRLALRGSVKKILITHSPKQGVDFTYMKGVNEELYNPNLHNIISCSICDSNAVGPFYKMIDSTIGIELGEITTLHPWLSYQNLLDGNLKSVSSPGHFWTDYALGRSSIGNLIPKNTTLVDALNFVIPNINNVISASSFRVPTSIVAAAVGSFLLSRNTTLEELYSIIENYSKEFPNVLKLDDRSLVSLDYLGSEFAAVIDGRWLSLNKGKLLKFILWYDNEWGYSFRVYNSISELLK